MDAYAGRAQNSAHESGTRSAPNQLKDRSRTRGAARARRSVGSRALAAFDFHDQARGGSGSDREKGDAAARDPEDDHEREPEAEDGREMLAHESEALAESDSPQSERVIEEA